MIRLIEKKREAESKAFQTMVDKIKTENSANIKPITDKFAPSKVTLEEQLKNETLGLVTFDSFRKKREDLTLEGPSLPPIISKKRKGGIVQSKLSFTDQDESSESLIFKKTLKDPSVDTSFLPDRERDEMERKERLLLKKEWIASQEKIKGSFYNFLFIYLFFS